MSTVITLTTAKDVIDTGVLGATPKNNRFDASKISTWLQIGEQRFLRKPKAFICDEFYNFMLSEVNPTPANYNPKLGAIVEKFPNDADLETLWTQHLLPYVSLAVYYIALPNIVISVGSNGAFLANTEFAQNVGVSGLKVLQTTTLENLKDLRDPIVKFLCDNEALYPLFCREGVCKCSCDGCIEGGTCTGELNEDGRDLGLQFY